MPHNDQILSAGIFVDRQRFGALHMISSVGVDREGGKHILGIELIATENCSAVKAFLTRLRKQGLPTDCKYLFVVDGAKAAEMDEVFGTERAVQCCRGARSEEKLMG